jgi:hypothetical protein
MPFWFSNSSSSIKEYQRYRKAARDLNHKMMETYIDGDVLEKAARWLKLGKNRLLVMDSEDDLSVLMDFSLYEIKRNGKNIIARYADEKGGRNSMERELLSAMQNAQTGLFKIDGVDKGKCQLKLGNLIDARQSVTLTDINFSKTMPNGVLIYCRPIRFSTLAMTSGIAFVFPQELEQELVAKWRELKTNDVGRYGWFFRRSKHTGFETKYA